MLRIITVGLLVLMTAAAWRVAEPERIPAAPAAAEWKTQIRRPVALIVQDEILLVGNRESGSITVIGQVGGKIIAEHSVARSIADMLPLGEDSLLVLDDARRQLLKVAGLPSTPRIQILAELPFAGSKLAFDEPGGKIFISGKWAHSVLALTLDEHRGRIVQTQTYPLPFAPLELLLLAEHRTLLAADAFGNRLAVLDADKGTLRRIHEIEGHNIRGLALSDDGRSVLIAHQQMPEKALADYEEVHWGRMVTHGLQVLEIRKLLDSQAGQAAEGWLDSFGGIGRAMADPSGVITGPNGLVAVAFSGVGEIAVRYQGTKRRLPVQSHPEAMAAAGDRLYVANRLDDSISVIDLARGEVRHTISLGPKPRLSSEQRGEKLFFNARLSHDGWLSCHSCHTEGHTAGLIVDTLGDGDYGAPKLVPTLLGTRDTQPWSWDGSKALLRGQIQQSITTTMHGEPLGVRDMEDLFAYLTSLDSPPPTGTGSQKLIAEGQAIFRAKGCVNCHAPPAYTTPVTVDVSLMDEFQRTRFNPPSLRGVGQRRRFFHDGRAKCLEDVVLKIRHQLDDPLKPQEAQALLAFLRSL